MSAVKGATQTRSRDVGAGADRPPLIFLIAGEPSGDVLGARLMAALSARLGDHVAFDGIGGAQMSAAGMVSRFPMEDLSVMGAAEIVPRLPKLLRRIRETVAAIKAARPDVVVTIDSPGFCFRVGKRLHGSGIPIVHFVAPQVWAWKAHRAREIAGFLDHLLALLPFEPPIFEEAGLPCTFVGHPVVESGAGSGDGRLMRARLGLGANEPLVCLLPGSRQSETRRLMPVYAETAARLLQQRPVVRFVLPAVDALRADIASEVERWPVTPGRVQLCPAAERFDAFAAADVALAASGTVSLELAMARTPMVITYRLNPMTAWLARRVIRVPHVNLINLIVDEAVVPELLQNDCRPDRAAAELIRLLDDPSTRARQRGAADRAIAALRPVAGTPSARAADVIASVVASAGRR